MADWQSRGQNSCQWKSNAVSLWTEGKCLCFPSDVSVWYFCGFPWCAGTCTGKLWHQELSLWLYQRTHMICYQGFIWWTCTNIKLKYYTKYTKYYTSFRFWLFNISSTSANYRLYLTFKESLNIRLKSSVLLPLI